MAWVVPKRLLGHMSQPGRVGTQQHPKTVYTLRITTSSDRKASLSEPASGVLVCLVNDSGDSLLRYIPNCESASDVDSAMREICANIEDIPLGADCSLSMGSPAPDSKYTKHRFEQGAVSEVSFVGPNLGPHLCGVIVGPQSGTWGCSDVVVSSSAEYGGISCKFLNTDGRMILGEDPLHSAAYLERVPDGSIVYGQGESARVLSASDALEVAAKNMVWYNTMKKKLLFYTATVGCVGMFLVQASLGSAAALSFGCGSLASFGYQLSLQKKVDTIGAQPTLEKGANMRLSSPLINALPLVGVSLAAWTVYSNPSLLGQTIESSNDVVDMTSNFSLTMALLAGFASQKLAVILFSVEGVPGFSVQQRSSSVDASDSSSSSTSSSNNNT